MSDNEVKGLCPSCDKSIFCPTWAEWKCLADGWRFSIPAVVCESYKKRGRQFKERACQCEDCLKNELLERQEEEE